MTRSSYNFLLS